MKQIIFSVIVLAASVSVGRSADLESGPPVGTALTAVPCYANSGPYSGRESFDAAKELGESPGLFLFIHVLNRNTAPVIRGVDQLALQYGLLGFKTFTVTLSDDRTSGEEQLQRVNGSLRLSRPLVLSLDGLEGPGGLALNRRCTLSLIAVKDGKVVKSLGLTDTGLYDIERIQGMVEKTIGEVPRNPRELFALAQDSLPEDVDELRALAARQSLALYQMRGQATRNMMNSRGTGARQRSMAGGRGQMRRPEGGGERPATNAAPESNQVKRERRGAPPEDPTLNSLLRSYIRKTNDEARINEIFGEIEERSQESDALHQEAIAMFQLMLSFPDRYGTDHAQTLARNFLKQHNAE